MRRPEPDGRRLGHRTTTLTHDKERITLGYLIRRLIQALIVIIGVVLLIFILFHAVPGGPARATLGTRATPAAIQNFNQVNGYNLPLWDQFWRYLRQLVVHQDLGYSYKFNQSVSSLIGQRLPKTLLLVGCSLVLTLIVAIPLGILQVVRRNTVVDYFFTGVSFVLYAMPSFFVGLLLIEVFIIKLGWFTISQPNNNNVSGIIADPRYFVLPVLTLSAITIASFSRYMRSSMMEALTQDYVRTARAKGASPRRVLYSHALRNALIPIVTLLGLSLPPSSAGP